MQNESLKHRRIYGAERGISVANIFRYFNVPNTPLSPEIMLKF
jgi:hypothetical protein